MSSLPSSVALPPTVSSSDTKDTPHTPPPSTSPSPSPSPPASSPSPHPPTSLHFSSSASPSSHYSSHSAHPQSAYYTTYAHHKLSGSPVSPLFPDSSEHSRVPVVPSSRLPHSSYSSNVSGTPGSPEQRRTPSFSESLSSSSSTLASSSSSPYAPPVSASTSTYTHQYEPFNDKDNGAPASIQLTNTPLPVYIPPKPKKGKIPRPPNSFLIFRAHNTHMYAGLVATELSAKLGRAWRNAPQELRDRYDALAEEAKKEHAATYPDYKFTPVKRGTGKRALKLAAQAADAEMAEMDAATLLMSMAFHSAPLINGNDGPPASTTAGRSTPPSVAAIGRPKGPQRIKVRKPNTARAIAVTKLPVLAPASNRPVSNASSTGSTRLNRNVARAIPIPGIHMDVSPAPAPLSATTASASVTTAPAPGSPPETATTETAVTDSEQDSQPRRPQPQLSPAMFVFRESIARRSPDTSSSLVAPIVMNAWLKVSQGVRDYYENRAETDPRFQGKNKTIPLIRCENKRPNKRRLAAAVAAAAAAASEAAAEPAGPSATRTRRKIVPVVSTLKLKAAAVTKPTKSIARARAVRPVPTAVADAVLPSKSNKRKAKQGSPSPSPSDSETSPRPQKIMKILSSDHQERHEHQEHQEQEQVHEQEQALTPANRPKRNIVRPGRYSK